VSNDATSQLGAEDLETLEAIQRRVLWLAVRMVDWANHERPDAGGIKVGGHQASSASMVSIMTALWFAHLNAEDLVSVKPHASPVFHAIQYLLGNLDRKYLTELRSFHGLQAYPSRTKDPDVVDFSTGSVGLGAVAPLFAAATRRYVDAHFGPRPKSRFVALMGDAELDEGNVWEAIVDPSTQGLGDVLWVVDLNRQSLDRVIPGIKAARLQRLFADNGWHVVEAKYGHLLQAAFEKPGGEALRRHIDDMSNEEYQSLFALRGAELRDRFLAGADAEVKRLLADVSDDDLAPLVQNLGGHDLGELLRCFREADEVTDMPSVVFAYTVKGWGLPMAGDPLNHSALLAPAQIDAFRGELNLTAETEWDTFTSDEAAGRKCTAVADHLRRPEKPPRPEIAVPDEVGVPAGKKPVSTQETFGRLLVGLGRHDDVAGRIVTTSPDVSVSTNLGGWINKTGVFSPAEEPDWLGTGRLLRWSQSPAGQHIELGISEMNLFMLLSQLGLADDLSAEPLLPIGTLYDPFVCRGLDALIYAVYSGARFVVVGTPSGVTLSPEGGAHQSTITASIGMELPGLTLCEPAYAAALDWLLCDGLGGIASGRPGSLYLRLTTRPIDQSPFDAAVDRLGKDELRRQVLAGAYRLIDATAGSTGGAPVVLAASGAVLPEVVAAATALADEGVAATVIDVTSADRLYRGWQESQRQSVRAASPPQRDFQMARLLDGDLRRAPIVTVHDAASHALAWMGSVFGSPIVALGVDDFGQSGTIDDLYAEHDLVTESIVNAALVALDSLDA
jgi:pyruvate dehydrogenase E1 component